MKKRVAIPDQVAARIANALDSLDAHDAEQLVLLEERDAALDAAYVEGVTGWSTLSTATDHRLSGQGIRYIVLERRKDAAKAKRAAEPVQSRPSGRTFKSPKPEPAPETVEPATKRRRTKSGQVIKSVSPGRISTKKK